jgi:hypothetical protein
MAKSKAETKTADKPKDPTVPDAEIRNRPDQVQEDAVTAQARQAAPGIVAAVSDAIKEAAASAETAKPSGDGSFLTTPTPTQLQETAPFPRDGEEAKELKIVRHDNLPGQPPTTLKEEVRVVPQEILSGDEEADKNTLAVLAKTQGINQLVQTGDGVEITKQDGTVFSDKVEGEMPAKAEEPTGV